MPAFRTLNPSIQPNTTYNSNGGIGAHSTTSLTEVVVNFNKVTFTPNYTGRYVVRGWALLSNNTGGDGAGWGIYRLKPGNSVPATDAAPNASDSPMWTAIGAGSISVADANVYYNSYVEQAIGVPNAAPGFSTPDSLGVGVTYYMTMAAITGGTATLQKYSYIICGPEF